MFLNARVNGHWIRMKCADNFDAVNMLLRLRAGGCYVDRWFSSA